MEATEAQEQPQQQEAEATETQPTEQEDQPQEQKAAAEEPLAEQEGRNEEQPAEQEQGEGAAPPGGKGEEGKEQTEGDITKQEATGGQEEDVAATGHSEDQKDEEPKPKPRKLRTKVRSADPEEGVELLIGDSGLEAEEPITVGQMFQATKDKLPDGPALKYVEEGVWKVITYAEYYNLCIRAAKSFLKLGLEPMHAVSIIGFNSPEWLIANLGAMFAGGLAAGMYTTNSPEACQYVASDCKANVVVVEDKKQLNKILEVRDHLPHLKAIVQYKGKVEVEDPKIYEWEQFMKLGEDMDNSVIEEKIKAQRPEQCALLIYTSGTTGNPKAVMLSHDTLTWTSKTMSVTSVGGFLFGGERSISYLPLSHAAAQMTDIYAAILAGSAVHFAQPDVLKGSLVQILKDVQPTIFFGVPRVYEKIMERMQEQIAGLTGLKRRVSVWARNKGLRGNRNRQKSQPLPWGWTFANKLVFKKVREALGLQHCRLFIVGAAPTYEEVHDFFMSINMPLMDLYGMSECCGPHTMNLMRPGYWKPGSVGRKFVGVELKIHNPDEDGNGEICMRGRNVFMGYLNKDEKTMETIDDEGWLHSGDIGKVDQDGFLYITGRIKELIITSGGENIPPVLIENVIKKEVPFLSNVMVVGDNRKYLTCLVTLKCDMDPNTGEPQDTLLTPAKQQIAALGSSCTTVSQIVEQKDEAVFTAIQQGLERANEQATSRAQKVQKFKLLDKDFSIPGEELGPTLKLKRQVVLSKYAEVIDGLYAE